MAGGNEADCNPIHLNVVPIVDVVFCLCVFFMCCFKTKQFEGQFSAWLPTDIGSVGVRPLDPPEIRVALFWDANKGEVVRRFGSRFIRDDDELRSLISGARADARRSGEDLPVIVGADARVPWSDVTHVVDVAKSLGIDRVEFAFGATK